MRKDYHIRAHTAMTLHDLEYMARQADSLRQRLEEKAETLPDDLQPRILSAALQVGESMMELVHCIRKG